MAPCPVIVRTVLAGFVALVATVAAAFGEEEIPRGRVVERVICRGDPTQSYALYLPSTYDPARRWPVLYCFDPGARGRVPVERFREAAEKYGYVVAGSNNSRNGPWAENITAIEAMLNDAGPRFSLDAGRRYAAGFSGGARVAVHLALAGVAKGVVACSGAFSGGETPAKVAFPLFGTAGTDDFNYPEMRRTDGDLDATGSSHRIVVFAGGHEWLPPELALEAIGWLELQAMRAGKIPRNEALIQATFEQRRTAASSLPPPEAWLELKSLAADFQGLADTREVVQQEAALAKTREVRAWRKQEREAEQRQLEMEDELFSLAADGRRERLSETVAARRRQAAAAEDSTERRLARRVLQGAGITSLERARALMAQKEFDAAAGILELAAVVHPERAQTHYDLARARALLGERRAALAALQAAVAAGFNDAARAAQDAAFARLRTEAAFQQQLAEMKK